MKEHFWKILSTVALVGVFYLAYHLVWRNDFPRTSKLEISNKGEKMHPDSVLSATDRQSGPATIAIKEQNRPLTGFVSGETDGDTLVLNTVFSAEGREELTAIPWDNVLYVKMDLKPIAGK